MTVRFKNNNVADIVSIESELIQLEAVIEALECAHVNPELATLLYNSEVSVESFGDKVKDTAKKIWEAIVAFFKKLFNFGKKTEADVKDVLRETQDMPGNVKVPSHIAEQQRIVDGILRSVLTYDQLKVVLDDINEKCPDIPKNLINPLLETYFRYYGHYYYYADVGSIHDVSRQIRSAIDRYSSDGDAARFNEEITSLMAKVVSDALGGEDPTLSKINMTLKSLHTELTPLKIPFAFDRSLTQCTTGELRKNIENITQPLPFIISFLNDVGEKKKLYENDSAIETKAAFKAITTYAKSMLSHSGRAAAYFRSCYRYVQFLDKQVVDQ